MASEQFASYDEAMAYLFSLTNYEKGISHRPRTTPKLGLERVSMLLEHAGNPHLRLPAIHIAGTKGKGSTATMVANTLARAGYKTGLFVSPHVEDVRERIQLNGQWIPTDAVLRQMNAIRDYLRRSETRENGTYKPTFFEAYTAIAFMFFAEQNVDFAVVEVGMGGRLDTTNVLNPLVCGITPVSMDHVEQLGSTLREIAGEKAGIIKPGVPVVCGRQQPDALDVITAKARELGAPMRLLDQDITIERSPSGAKIKTWNTMLSNVKPAMPGEHQVANAATALGLLSVLKDSGAVSLSDQQLLDGISTASCPARVEVVSRRPLTVVDASHNIASIQVLLDTLNTTFAYRRMIFVFSVAQDKDITPMLRLIFANAAHVVFTLMDNPRAASTEMLAEMAESMGYRDYSTEPVIANAVRRAQSLAQDDDLICVCGSFYLAGTARKVILDSVGEKAGDNVIELPSLVDRNVLR